MRGVALPKSSAEALHVTGCASDVRETRIPAERPISKYPEFVSLRTIHLSVLFSLVKQESLTSVSPPFFFLIFFLVFFPLSLYLLLLFLIALKQCL